MKSLVQESKLTLSVVGSGRPVGKDLGSMRNPGSPGCFITQGRNHGLTNLANLTQHHHTNRILSKQYISPPPNNNGDSVDSWGGYAKRQAHTVIRFNLPRNEDQQDKAGRFGKEMFRVVTSCPQAYFTFLLLQHDTASANLFSYISYLSHLSQIHGFTLVYILLSSTIVLTLETSSWRTITQKWRTALRCTPILSTFTRTARSTREHIRLSRASHPQVLESAQLSSRYHKRERS